MVSRISGRKIRSVALPIGPSSCGGRPTMIDWKIGVRAHGHRLDAHERERLDRRVEAGVITERPFRVPRARLDPPFEDHLRRGRHLQRDRDAVDHVDPVALQESGEQVLVDVGRQRRGRRVGDRGRAAERDGDRQPLAAALGNRGVRGRVLVDLPVQADRPLVVLLQAIQPEVARAGLAGAWCGSGRGSGTRRRHPARP